MGPPRRTVRLRLTLLYGGLFLVSGILLIGLVYLLVAYGPFGVPVPAPQPPAGLPELPVAAPPEPQLPDWAQERVDRQRVDDLDRLLAGSAAALAGTAGLALALGWLTAGRVLRPLGTMTATVRRISADDLERRLAATGPDDELKELADTFDALLDRLQAAFAAQRRFVAHASHELRTPLALQRAVIEVTLADPDADTATLRDALRRLIRSGEEQERLIEALLTLARSEQGLARRQEVDLAAAGRAAMAELDDARTSTQLGPAHTAGDPELLDRLAGNLIDNAIRHHVPDGAVTVSTSQRGGWAVLRVANPGGRPVPPGQVDALLEPFHRLDPNREDTPRGLGLGLSIVAAIVRAHHGRLDVRPLREGGLDITVELPAAGLR
jgi:signal transduction histidine kinase